MNEVALNSSTAAAAGARAEAALPPTSPLVLKLFRTWVRRYLARHFNAVRVAHGERVREIAREDAVVIYLNHAAWWDPLLCLFLSATQLPDRFHCGPIDAAMLERYGIFKKLGFFGVETGTARGARTLLRTGAAVREREGTALWITPQGRFADPRERPVGLEGGLGLLAAHVVRRPGRRTLMVPIAIEYPFWEEREPEALVLFGHPFVVAGGGEDAPEAWTRRAEVALEAAQDELAARSCERDAEAFETVLRGRAGTSPVYDTWRRLRARLGGHAFRAHHGEHQP